ncbi:MAG: 3-isopropylmalate dehydratase small subunit [Pseudomonadota bacterium]
MKYEGKVWKFDDHVDTDLIIPARFLNVSDEAELAKNCFADFRPDFIKNVGRGDIVVAGINFGCGSSREHAPVAMKAAGVGAVIAKTFARIFYRNSFNIGLPLLESEEAAEAFSEGDRVSIDLSAGEIKGLDRGERFFAKPIPDFMLKVIEAGGMVPYIKAEGSF